MLWIICGEALHKVVGSRGQPQVIQNKAFAVAGHVLCKIYRKATFRTGPILTDSR